MLKRAICLPRPTLATSANKSISFLFSKNKREKDSSMRRGGAGTLCEAFLRQLFTWASALPISAAGCVAGGAALAR